MPDLSLTHPTHRLDYLTTASLSSVPAFLPSSQTVFLRGSLSSPMLCSKSIFNIYPPSAALIMPTGTPAALIMPTGTPAAALIVPTGTHSAALIMPTGTPASGRRRLREQAVEGECETSSRGEGVGEWVSEGVSE
eukprot:GHVU01158731.1.p2 GENE.GHVU01158731.1~~GHVU01158731.1.p2  ORF type:complete len:135 (+),score=15.25 GHVU01158731.1:392-796(+)